MSTVPMMLPTVANTQALAQQQQLVMAPMAPMQMLANTQAPAVVLQNPQQQQQQMQQLVLQQALLQQQLQLLQQQQLLQQAGLAVPLQAPTIQVPPSPPSTLSAVDSDVDDAHSFSADGSLAAFSDSRRVSEASSAATTAVSSPVHNSRRHSTESEPASPKQQRCPYILRRGAWDDRRNLIVTNLPASLTDNGLRKLFVQFGTITRVHVVRDRESDASRRFGFVEFEHAPSAGAAMQMSRKLTPVGSEEEPNPEPLVIAYGRRSSERRAGNTAYISGFGACLKEAGLVALCKEYGSVVSARVLDPKKHTDGVAFVKFASADDAAAACRVLDGSDVMCRPGQRKTLRARLSDAVGKTEQRQRISNMLKDVRDML